MTVFHEGTINPSFRSHVAIIHLPRMGIRFQDRTVHKGPGIAFITVADHVFGEAFVLSGFFPFISRRETRSSPTAQARFFHLGDDLLRGHLGDGLVQGHVPIFGDVFVNVLRIDQSAVAQYTQNLQAEKRNIFQKGDDFFLDGFFIKKLGNRAAFEDMLFHDQGHVFRFQLAVEDAFGINHHDRPFGAETIAARDHDLYFFIESPVLKFLFQALPHLEGSARDTGGTGAHKEVGPKNFHCHG